MSPELLEKDPENILLARGPRQRLSAHTARDQALALSGLLVERQGGPSVSPYQPDKLWDLMSNMKYKQSEGDEPCTPILKSKNNLTKLTSTLKCAACAYGSQKRCSTGHKKVQESGASWPRTAAST